MNQNSKGELQDCTFTQLADVFFALKEQGKTLGIEELVSLAPHLEAEIRQQFPTIFLLEKAIGGKTDSICTESIPKFIAGYEIKNEIGRGGMGVVYQAHQAELNREVAIKVIETCDDISDQSGRFELERHAMAKLEHPNIVPAYSFTQNKRHAFLAMRLIDGHGLNQLMNDEGDYRVKVRFAELKSDWSCFASMAADVASGLQHAHENGLVHRDIKPGNLLLDRDGKIWITDFGLAKMHDFTRVVSMSGDIVGTPKYMAPEQIQGICDPRSDIYSLGMTLYELAAGQPARGKEWRPGQLGDQTVPQIQNLRDLNPCIPGDLAAVIMKACHFLPEERYQSAQELETVLRRFLGGRVADRRKKKRKPDAIFRKEYRRKMIICAVMSMLICGGGMLFWIEHQRTDTKAALTMAVPQAADFLGLLADNPKDLGASEDVGEFLRASVAKSTDELSIPESEKKKLISEFNIVYDRIKSGDFRNRDLGELLDNYQDSNLSFAARIWRASTAIDESTLAENEKDAGKKVMHRFAYLATIKRLSPSETLRLCNSLTDGRSVNTVEFKSYQFSDGQVRAWIEQVDKATKPLMKEGEKVDVSDEIESIFAIREDSERRVAPTFTPASVKKWESKIRDTDLHSVLPGKIQDLKKFDPRDLTPNQIKQLKSQFGGWNN